MVDLVWANAFLGKSATSSSFRGSTFHETSFYNVIVRIQPLHNFFINGHR